MLTRRQAKAMPMILKQMNHLVPKKRAMTTMKMMKTRTNPARTNPTRGERKRRSQGNENAKLQT